MGRQIEELRSSSPRHNGTKFPRRAAADVLRLDTLGVILAGAERPGAAAKGTSGRHRGTGATAARGWPARDPHRRLLNGIAAVRSSYARPAPCHRPAGDAGFAGRAGGSRARAQQRARNAGAFVLGYDVAARFCAAFTRSRCASERPGIAAGSSAAGRACAALTQPMSA